MIQISIEDLELDSPLPFSIYDSRLRLLALAGSSPHKKKLAQYFRNGVYITENSWTKLRRKRIGRIFNLLQQPSCRILDLMNAPL